MDTEKIKELAERYAESVSPISEFERAHDKRDNLNEAYRKEALKVLEWLSKTHCIVEKSAIEKLDIAYRAKEYNLVVLNQDDVEMLFGKELFNESEK